MTDTPDGPRPTKTGGGLAAALRPALDAGRVTWIANPMSAADRDAAVDGVLSDGERQVVLTEVDQATLDTAIGRVANEQLWFLHHGMTDLARPSTDDEWHAFLELQQAMASTVASVAPADAVVLVQDYHLPLVARSLKEHRPDLRAVHFSHTPFADPASLNHLGTTRAQLLLEGMAAHVACGFHSTRWAEHHSACATEFGRAATTSFVAPIAPDLARVRRIAASPDVQAMVAADRERLGDRHRIVRVDRLEPTKNILRGFDALDRLLELHPELRGDVVMRAFAYPSRSSLEVYRRLDHDVRERAAALNQRWATDDWAPLELDLRDDRDAAVAAMVDHDVLLVNPVTDGLNLVAFEGIAVAERHGSLVLSETAGAHDLLGEVADSIDPLDVDGTAAALHRAITRSSDERRQRAERARSIAASLDIDGWIDRQVEAAR